MKACKNELELVESTRDNLEAMVENMKKEDVEDRQSSLNVPVDNNQSLYIEKCSQLEAENDELAEAVEYLKTELTEALKMNLQSEVYSPNSVVLSKFYLISFCRIKLKICSIG